MSKSTVAVTTLCALAASAVGQGLSTQPTIAVPQAGAAMTVAAFVPQHLFMSEEFDPAAGQMGRAGVEVVIVSSETTAAVSMSDSLGDLFVKPRLALRDVRPEYFGGLVLFGGSGATLYWNDSLLLQRVREFAAAGKLVAAIGTMPLALANAGVLKGRRATVFRERPAIAMLRAAGARHSFNNIVSDRGVITAADWRSARAFGRAVAAALRNR